MKKIITFVLLMFVSLVPHSLGAQNSSIKFTDVLPKLEKILKRLCQITAITFEYILITMNNVG